MSLNPDRGVEICDIITFSQLSFTHFKPENLNLSIVKTQTVLI